MRLTIWVLTALAAVSGVPPATAAGTGQTLLFHEIQVDSAGHIIPWYSQDPSVAYDHNVGLVWNWWKNLETCPNGLKYYLQHQVWRPTHDPRGLGGDQVAMALSSFNLLWAYSGDGTVVDNMRYLADNYIARSLSSSTAAWPNLPYPYNSSVHSGNYDGDMISGAGFLQPDKAASFGAELLVLYEITGMPLYLQTATAIADTLASKVTAGDSTHSPWPFRVHAQTGQVGVSPYDGTAFSYTTNWTGALRLFDELIRLGHGNVSGYAVARNLVNTWLKSVPMQNDTWGPFFEDVNRWSNTEINADTMAAYLLEHPEWDPAWQADSRAILDWSYATFRNTTWSQFGATAINEQSAYMVPGNSHTARHWSVELLYAEKTGDVSRRAEAIRGLNWATYMVDVDGKNQYPLDEIWLTDGYGDYVRHYLRAMAALPELAPAAANHLLRSTSVVRAVDYGSCGRVAYSTFDAGSRELLRLGFVPMSISAGGVALPHFSSAASLDSSEGYTFGVSGEVRGQTRVRHDHSGEIVIQGTSTVPPELAVSLGFANPFTLGWSASPGAFVFDVYRGSIVAGGWNIGPTCLRSRTAEPFAEDQEIPAPGSGFYYLVSGVNACGEGTLGARSDGLPRTKIACDGGVAPGTQTISFNDWPSNSVLNGAYPNGVITWGQGAWWASGPWQSFNTNSVSFNGPGSTSAEFAFDTPRRLVSLVAFNGGSVASTVTLSCTGNPTTQIVVGANQVVTISTDWTTACTTVVIGSSNGWNTNFDDLVIQ